jgi:hypothetical protein
LWFLNERNFPECGSLKQRNDTPLSGYGNFDDIYSPAETNFELSFYVTEVAMSQNETEPRKKVASALER